MREFMLVDRCNHTIIVNADDEHIQGYLVNAQNDIKTHKSTRNVLTDVSDFIEDKKDGKQ